MAEPIINPIPDTSFGATVTGVDIRELSENEFASIHRAFLERGFLVFPDQHLDEQASTAFGERFGDLEFGGQPMANQRKRSDGTFGPVFDLDAQIMRTNVGNEAWHTDSTYQPISSKCAMLSAVVVPPEGGETDLADARAAHDALDHHTQARIADLAAYHSTTFSQANDLGDFPDTSGDGPFAGIYHGEAYLRPLVKIHPETGRPSLMVGRHAFGVPGLDRQESRALLRSLTDFVVASPQRVYRHHWRPGDTLLWDNRCLLHRARPYDYRQPRYLIGTRVAGDPASELAYHPADPAAEAGRRALATELEALRTEAADRRYRATTASR